MQKSNKLLPYIVVFSASLFFCYELMQLHMLNSISPYLLRDLRIGAAEFGTLSSTYLLADVLFLLPAGIILDRYSPRKIILLAMAICILGTVGFAFSRSMLDASICHFLSGIGNAFCFLSCMILVSRWFPTDRQALIIGLVITVGLLGGIIAQTPLSLLAQAMNWRNALLIDATAGVVIYFLIYYCVQDQPDDFQKSSTGSDLPFWEGVRLSILNSKNLLCGLYTGLMNLPVMLIGAVFGSLYLTQIHNFSLTESSFIAGMICFGTIIGSPIFGHLSDRSSSSRKWMLLGSAFSLLAMGAILFYPHPSLLTMTLLFFALGFFTSTQVLGYPTITQSNPSYLTGTSMGIAAVIIMGLAAIGGPIMGKLIELNWNGLQLRGAPVYEPKDFLRAFMIFPIGFVISFIAAIPLKKVVYKGAKT